MGDVLRVLVVDDNDDDVWITTEHLAAGWPTPIRFARARDGAEALAMLSAERFDLCLLDHHLGRESGLDVLRAARARGDDVPVVMLTASPAHTIDVAASEAGADDYLDKCRVSPEALEHAVRYARVHREHVETLRRQNKALARLDREKNLLLGMAAHDLRNPIGVVRAYAEFLADNGDDMDGDEVRSILRAMEQSCAQMSGLIDELLDVSAIEAGTLVLQEKPHDIVAVIESVIADLAPIAGAKQITIELAAVPMPHVNFDRARFEQVLANLVGNAIKYSHPRTGIRVSVERAGEHVRVAVEDHGIGIAPEFLPRLFTPFSRAQRTGTSGERSTGLGLAIVKRIVEAHGGSIEVTSRRGEGSTFAVLLPIA
jgi:signal transduction histidine kinase